MYLFLVCAMRALKVHFAINPFMIVVLAEIESKDIKSLILLTN